MVIRKTNAHRWDALNNQLNECFLVCTHIFSQRAVYNGYFECFIHQHYRK